MSGCSRWSSEDECLLGPFLSGAQVRGTMITDAVEFEKIHEAFRPKIHRYLTGLVGEHEAEDLTQEVFIRVGQALKNFRGESQLSTWMYRIATNAAIDKLRNSSFRQNAGQILFDDSDEAGSRDLWTREEAPSIEQQLLQKQRYDCFMDYVQDLPLSHRTVIVLSELAELTNNEIAEILGLSLDVVKIRLHRGRTRLLQELKTHCKAEDWL
jgi:RNA polymerase sigma-70 factor (ECF subfamily)